MNAEADTLRRNLKRYRFLLDLSVDRPVVSALQELIEETESRLRSIEQAKAPD